MSDFEVFPVGGGVSIETHDRICRELHAEIRKLIVENGELRAKTTPPRREWRGLTEEDINEISDRIERSDFFDVVIPFARAIEAALKERNA